MKNIRKLLTVALILSVLQFSIRISNANPEATLEFSPLTTILYVSPSTTTVRVGEVFSVNVSVQDVVDLYAFYLFLGYNPMVLDALGVYVYPPFSHGPVTPPVIDDGYVYVSCIIGYQGPGVSGSFPLIRITFNATAPGNSTLHLYNTELRDSMLNVIAHISIDGVVKILNQDNVFPWGDWRHYHDYDEIVDTLLFLNCSFSNVVKVFSIRHSRRGRDIYCIRLTNETNVISKPKVLFVGYHHARERISAELPLYFAVQAATSFGADETITHMLNESEIYIIPALNVDGFEAVMQNEWQRKNVAPTDEDGDGLFDEDPPDDEDNDGYIEDLFYWDGTNYYFIRWEGIDNDGDGLLNEDWVGGVDLNRNYGYQWNAQCQSGSPHPWAEDYRGPAPFSEPETQALRDLMMHDFKYAVSFHSGTEYIGFPWGYTTDPTPDDDIFREIASNLSALVGAPYGQNSGLYTLSGSWDDWMYGNRSTFAFTCEIYRNDSAWQYEPGPEPNTWWEKGVFQFFNPDPTQIEIVIQRWLPVFTYITNRAINEFRYHNIAITNITPLKTIVGQGYRINISVTVTNQGGYTETFNVTLYANTTLIKIRTITLQSGESATLTFTWNTTGFVKGNYMLWAYAWLVAGETDTGDNTLIDGWIFVSIPGDVMPEFRLIDVYDVAAICAAYDAKKGVDGFYWHDCICSQCPHSSNLDVNDDGIIDIYDVVICTSHYDQAW